jgi:hypothetical protein
MPPEVRLEGVHCTFVISRPAVGVVLVAIHGNDTGEHGDAPFRELEKNIGPARAPIELFIDARTTRLASLNVSSDWARWLAKHRARFRHVSMLTGSRFIQLTADFVVRFADLGDTMRIYTDPAAFEGALSNSIANAPPE